MDNTQANEPFGLHDEANTASTATTRERHTSNRFLIRDREGRTKLELPLWLAILLALSAPQLALVVFVVILATNGSVSVDRS